MKKILILNFTRIGDLIQTTPLLAGLKEAHPGCEITLVGNVSFIGICQNLPNIDVLKVFDVKQFIHADGGATSILDVYRYLDTLVNELRAGKYDVLVNLSHSNLTAVMGRLLDIPEVHGMYSTRDGAKVVNDPWLAYFTSLLGFRLYNTFNLVDLYQLGGGVKPKARGLLIDRVRPAEEAKKLLAELGIADGETVVGIQAGASMKERRWPAAKFAEVADTLAQKWKAKVVLFGAAAEKELVDEVAEKMRQPVLNLAGKTSLEQLIGMVQRCALLVTNDTATMHIAAAAGTPIVGLFLVHAFAAETGPYCEQAVVIEPEIACFPCGHHSQCPHYACLDMVTPAHVVGAAEIAIAIRNTGAQLPPPGQFTGVRLLAPFFDEYGFMDLRPLQKMPLRKEDLLARLYRALFISAVVGPVAADYWKAPVMRDYVLPPGDGMRKMTEKERAAFRQLAAAATDGIQAVTRAERDLKAGKVEKVREKAREITDVDRRLEIAGLSNPELAPIVRLFGVGKANLGDTALEVMLQQTKMLYTEANRAAVVMERMLGEFAGA